MARISIFLIVVALIAGMVGCAQPAQYRLIISSTEGGEITTPHEMTSTYEEGTIVPLVALPHSGYRFVEWTGDVDTIDDVNAASTSIIMDGDHSITANFEETPTITFAVAGPMTEAPGEHHWWGAELARDEINSGPGVNVGGRYHQIELIQVDTNEVSGTPEESVAALEAAIDNVDFVVGGFALESVVAYREVAMDAKRLFMNCGPSYGSLQYSVVENYDRYKYWFKSMMINDVFIVRAVLTLTTTIGMTLKSALASCGEAVAEDYRVPETGKLRVAILAENATPYSDVGAVAEGYLPLLGFTVVGTWLVSPAATDITTELSQIAAKKPHIIFTAFSGLGFPGVGTVYSKQKTELGIPAMTMGINTGGALQSHWADTEGKCNGEIQLDCWSEGLENTLKTIAFFNAFVAKTGQYPVYTAGTYDAIYSLTEAVEAVSVAHGWRNIAEVIDPANIDALIQYLETSSYTSAAGTSVYYPIPEVDLGNGAYALSEEQVRTLYRGLGTYSQGDWLCRASAGPHIAHDIVYGHGYATGIGSQWQDGHKVGVWPIDLGDDYDAPLTNQYGCWNFEYPGTADVVIPMEGFLAS